MECRQNNKTSLNALFLVCRCYQFVLFTTRQNSATLTDHLSQAESCNDKDRRLTELVSSLDMAPQRRWQVAAPEDL